MQAYYDEEIVESKLKPKFFVVNFFGDNFNTVFENKTYKEFLKDELKDLAELKNEIKTKTLKGVIINGGEPLLQRQALINLFNFCKKHALYRAIKTNLSKPNVLKTLLKQQLIDIVIAEIKTDEKDFKKITSCETFFKTADSIFSDIKQSLSILEKEQENIEIIFVTNIVPGYVFRKETLLNIAKLINKMNAVWILKKFVPEDNELLNNVSPVSDGFMENLKEIIKKEYPDLMVEIE